MTLTIKDLVFETSNTTGTGTYSLAGPVTGFLSFSTCGNGAKVPYIANNSAGAYEIGFGTVTLGSPNLLARTTILASSNSNAAVNWGAAMNIRLAPLAGVNMVRDENLNFSDLLGVGGGTANAHTVTMPVPAKGYSDGAIFMYRPSVANTTAGFSINLDGQGVKAAKVNGADPGIGFAAVGNLIFCVYKAANNTVEILNLTKLGELAYQTRNLTIALNEKLVTVASAASANIWDVDGNVIDWTGTATATGFTAAPQAGASRKLICAGASVFTAGANMLINGVISGQNYTASAGDQITVYATATNQFRLSIIKANGTSVVAPPAGLTSGTAVAATSGTSIPFNSIPAGIKRITINLADLSTSGSSLVMIQIGDSGGIETTGYKG
ncbi:hypothetical protein, partial [Dyadobacter sp. CY323]|uniref:hypothetical protein n=1 Tax=Dyadobacter sp. CY323 TaxID=2907302 RepID=UPI001F21898F